MLICQANLVFWIELADDQRASFFCMQLNFLGNTYTKSSDLQVKPDVQLRYQGKVYQARRLEAVNALASNAIVLTYRGVSYTK